jgi:hypothetical protein
MSTQFSDRPTQKMIRALGGIKDTMLSAPTWFEIKQWLWKQKKYNNDEGGIHVETNAYSVAPKYKRKWFYKIVGITEFISGDGFDSPVEAEVEGIKKAVEFLHKQLKPS